MIRDPIRPQPQTLPRPRWGVVIALIIVIVATLGMVARSNCLAKGSSHQWFWLPILGTSPIGWGCEKVDD